MHTRAIGIMLTKVNRARRENVASDILIIKTPVPKKKGEDGMAVEGGKT